MNRNIILLGLTLLALSLILTACGSGKEVGTSTQQNLQGDQGTGVPGGTVTLSMFSSPGGMFNPTLYHDAEEFDIINIIYEGLVRQDLNLGWEPLLAKDWYYENEQKTLVFELNEDVKWHDGQPFTAYDVKITYEVIGHPDYTGLRRNITVERLMGIEEYMAGEVEELAGVEVVDNHTVKFHFKEHNIYALRDASFKIIPKHIFENIPVEKHREVVESLDFDRLIGTGPFKATTDWLTGEYYYLARNDDYWRGKPKLEGVIWRVVNEDVAPGLLQTGELDFMMLPSGYRLEDVDFVQAIPGVDIYETPVYGYQYIGFKFHHRSPVDISDNVYNPDNWVPNSKLHDVNLRQAIAYAIDREGIVKEILDDHGAVVHGPFPQASWAYDESVLQTYPYNPGKAKQLLDEAGYKDVTNDGWREDPNGNELIIRLDYASDNRTREQVASYIQKALAEVGIRIDLRAPRERLLHLDAIAEDEPGMDLYLAGWRLSVADPNPIVLWDTTSPFNYTRWVDTKSQELLHAAIKTPEALEQQYRANLYQQWAAHLSEQLPHIFLYTQNNIFAYNSRIQNITFDHANITRDIHLWYIAD